MKNMKLSTKLIAGFLFIAVISGIVGVVGIYSLRQITKADEELYTYNTIPLASIGSLGMNFQEVRVLFRDVSEEQDEARRKEKMTQIEQLRKENAENLKKIEAAVNTPEKKKLLENLKIGVAGYNKAMDKMSGQINSGMGEAAKGVLQTDGLLAARQLNEAISKFFDASMAEAGRNSEKNSSLAVRSNAISMVLTGVNVIAAILFGFLMTVVTTRPINRAIEGLMGAAAQVGEEASQVAGASQRLAGAASQQAASLEETSSSLEEMSSMTKQNADNAGQAKAMMDEAKQVFEGANTQMTRLAEAIGQITRSSEETGKIVKTIDEISFQTNLLALNAAVEAARAGEAGAGFAVVADEVRNLALRAAEAARNTSELIERTIKEVKNGNQMTVSTQEAFRSNADLSLKIAQLVDEIAAASQEQAHGIAQLNTAVGEMDRVTQQTAADAEESASSAEEMSAQAVHMRGYIDELAAVIGGNRGTSASRPSGGALVPAERQ